MRHTVAYDGEEYEGGVDIAKELVYVKKTGSPPGRAAVSYEQLEKLGGGFHHLYGAARLILEEHRIFRTMEVPTSAHLNGSLEWEPDRHEALRRLRIAFWHLRSLLSVLFLGRAAK